MNYSIDNHPSEEVLLENALHFDGEEEIRAHLNECEECSEFVDEMQMIGKDICDIKEEDIPFQLQSKILSITKKKQGKSVVVYLQNWYKNPFLFGLITALSAVMLFVVFEFFLQ